MLQAHTPMFQPIADLLQWRDTEQAMPSHPSQIPSWQQEVQQDIQRLLELDAESLIPNGNQESFFTVQEMGFNVLEQFLQAALGRATDSRSSEERLERAKAVLARPQIPQRTPAWYAQGKEVLTASEFANLFGSPRAVGQLVLHKVPLAADAAAAAPQTNRLACRSCDMGPFDWGVRFEPVLKQVLVTLWGVEIAEAGRIVSATDSKLAASPDGILLAAAPSQSARVGRLLELKCPISRKVGAGVPFDYWCQMQIQMEVTGIEECEYVEAKFDSLTKTVASLAPLPEGAPKPLAEGELWLFQHEATLEMRYAYTEEERPSLLESGWTEIETIPWRVAALYAETVTRDTKWYASTEEKRAAFWRDVEAARAGTYVAAPSSKPPRVVVTKEGCGTQQPQESVCQILDD